MQASLYRYMFKCVIGTSLCYVLYISFPGYPFYWSIISAVLVFSEDNINDLAFNYMKANVLGSVTGLALYFIPANNLLVMLSGTVMVIYAGTKLNLGNAIRTALAALIIVLLKEEIDKKWSVALSRVICVVSGCIIAWLVTVSFYYFNRPMNRKKQNNLISGTKK
jgi:uncharacterized membrane protein YgaE (UPF0421/DUF939 family)